MGARLLAPRMKVNGVLYELVVGQPSEREANSRAGLHRERGYMTRVEHGCLMPGASPTWAVYVSRKKVRAE